MHICSPPSMLLNCPVRQRLWSQATWRFTNFVLYCPMTVRWMCGVKLKDRLPSKELRERLGIDDIALVLQQNRLRWYGHVLRKEDDDWVKKCTEYEVEGPRPRGRPKRTWREVVREDCQARKLNKEDAMDRCKWRKMIKDVRWSGWVWVGECFLWCRPTQVVPDKRPLNGCVCVCVCVCYPEQAFLMCSAQRLLEMKTKHLFYFFINQLELIFIWTKKYKINIK